MRWKDINKEFGKGIDMVDKLGYNKIHLLGFLIDRFNPEKMNMAFVIGDKNYQNMLYKKSYAKDDSIWCMDMELIRK